MMESHAGLIPFWESGEGPSVLLLSGASNLSRMETVDLAPLSQYHIIVPDLSESYRLSKLEREDWAFWESQARRSAALMEALGIDRYLVIGVCSGCLGAFELSMIHPEHVAGLLIDSMMIEMLELRGANAGDPSDSWLADVRCPVVLVGSLGDNIVHSIERGLCEAARKMTGAKVVFFSMDPGPVIRNSPKELEGEIHSLVKATMGERTNRTRPSG
jgi:hypothetical protein